jgi:hypothetical protein
MIELQPGLAPLTHRRYLMNSGARAQQQACFVVALLDSSIRRTSNTHPDAII